MPYTKESDEHTPIRRLLLLFFVGLVLAPMVGRQVSGQNAASTVEETTKDVLKFEDTRPNVRRRDYMDHV